jgi:hypothetical protein
MFNQMSQVGRETAVQRDVSTQYQFLQGNEMVRKTEADDRAVNQTRELGDGLEKVKEERQRQKRRQGRGGAQERTKGQAPEEHGTIFDDPDLGHHVDLVG